jgi:hypothetical protein
MENINALDLRKYYLSSTSFIFDPAKTILEDDSLTENCFSLREILTDHKVLSESQQRLVVLKSGNKPDKFLMMTRNSLNFNKKDCSIVNFTDITSVRQVSTLKNQNELLSMLNANLSHELNTPLNCIN